MLNKLFLTNFRNYAKREFEFNSKTLIVGDNGAGKSNIMEAIYLLATGKSFRADYDSEMILYEKQFSIINSQFSINDQFINLQITVTDRKKYEVNGVPRRQIDFVGNMRAVLFAPQDMELVTGSPGRRRRYLDFVITQMDREYRRCLISYEKGLRQRNKLLFLIRDSLAQRHQLYFWDHLLIKNGEYLTLAREKYLRELPAVYDKSIITEERLKQYEVEEVASATTLVGPHRDDFQILFQDKDVAKFGSRGEQRMSVLKLKQREIEYLGGQPVLLLDDIFSELDHVHREEVMKMVKDYPGQVVMTAVDQNLAPVGGIDVVYSL